MRLLVYIEIDGKEVLAGRIEEDGRDDFGFIYDSSYMNRGVLPISLSLPFSEERYSAVKTRNFFEGLLPEGFTRRAVANKLHVDEQDYIALLKALGQECLGAIRVVDETDGPSVSGYERLSLNRVKALAAEGATSSADLVTQARLSLTGASGKVGLYWDSAENEWYLPRGTAPSTHIVKQSHVRYSHIVANEQFCMATARKLGIVTPDSFIVNVANGGDDEVLFATKRYDRLIDDSCPLMDGLPRPYRLHQEDFASALGIPSAMKYENPKEHYLKDAFRLLADNVTDPIKEQLRLWDLIVFDYLIGNTDNHLKNISLIYNRDMKKIALAPAYDIVSTRIYEGTSKNMSMAIGGKTDINEINEDCFRRCASEVGLGQKLAMRRYEDLRNRFEAAVKEAEYEMKEQGIVPVGYMGLGILRGCNLVGESSRVCRND